MLSSLENLTFQKKQLNIIFHDTVMNSHFLQTPVEFPYKYFKI